MAIPDPIHPKSELRKTMRRMLRTCPPDSRTICNAVARWLAARPALELVAVFSALPGEIDLSGLAARLPERRWAYPRVVGEHLIFHAVRVPARELTPGAFGIAEPPPDAALIEISHIDAFLCPGLAFDPRGGRLGRGRGFYDRALAHARPDAVKLGVCFPFQIVPDTFAEPHDIPMDEVLGVTIEHRPPNIEL